MIWTRGTKLTTAPAVEPITTEIAKNWLKVDTSADDALIDLCVSAARSHIEQMSGLALFTQSISDVIDAWPTYDSVSNPYREFHLLRYPVQEVSGIQYVDSDGNAQTLSTDVYSVNTNGLFTSISLKSGQSWPSLSTQAAAVTVNYIAGWDDVDAIPANLKMAVQLFMTDYYEGRGDWVNKYRTAAENIVSKHYCPVI